MKEDKPVDFREFSYRSPTDRLLLTPFTRNRRMLNSPNFKQLSFKNSIIQGENKDKGSKQMNDISNRRNK